MPVGVYERKRKPLSERFWAKVQKAGPDECWLWTGALTEGYGRILIVSAMVDGRREVHDDYAHRVSYWLETGIWPGKNDIRHSCHNRACVNPRHLSTGTRADNMQDMVEAGRSLVGELQPNHKLTWGLVRWARMAKSNGLSTIALARHCGVSERTMRQCLAGETWVEAGER